MLRRAVVVMATFCFSGNILADAKTDCKKLEGQAAITACNKVIQRNPSDADAYFNRAYANSHDEFKNYDEAIADYTRTLELDPNNGAARINRSLVYEDKNDCDRAISELTDVILNHCKNCNSRGWRLSYWGRGRCFIAKADHASAIADFSSALEYKDKDDTISILIDRARALHAHGEHDRAISDYSKVIALDSKKLELFGQRAASFAAKGDHARAVSDYNKAIANEPEDPDLLSGRAASYEALGKRELAIADYRKAMSEWTPVR